MDELLPDKLKSLWRRVDEALLSHEEFNREQERYLSEYRHIWFQSLLLNGSRDIEESTLREICSYSGIEDAEEARRRCLGALSGIKKEWQDKVTDVSRKAVEHFYDESQSMLYELLWWHTLVEDLSPLAYVVALRFAVHHGCSDYLDFGSGVGSGGILFARHGFRVTLADISSVALGFSRWRFERRNLPAAHIDLKSSGLPDKAFDMVTAMDVFEHLVDPVTTLRELGRTIKKGGFLMGRFHAEQDADRPHHIILDFDPTFRELAALGFVEVWKDEWLWGHQVFQKS
jgi:mycofactocin glycosyltransferase